MKTSEQKFNDWIIYLNSNLLKRKIFHEIIISIDVDLRCQQIKSQIELI